jgi:prepilin-type N-terminal cleavage/methylation domain-containing protein
MKRTSGFTIIELLIVIVVIAILASISVVAYNGIQTRAKNTKTINATVAWIKALKLYNAETDSWPGYNSCFGTTSTYQGEAGQCWPGGTWVVNSNFLNQMQPYISNYPEPDTTDINPASGPKRGAFYHISGADRFIWMMQIDTSTCPDVGLPANGNTAQETSGRRCVYKLN